MRLAVLGCVLFFIAVAVAAPAKPSDCSKACPFNYDPLCATPEAGSGADLSFGNKCVLDNYNCEHGSAKYREKAKGECPGGTSIRLQ